MRKFFGMFVMMLCLFVTSVSAQNWYTTIGLGFDIMVDNGKNTNQTINAQVGYFFDASQALELDYSHGFQKDFTKYNRIGANYVFEFQTRSEVCPYIKLGGAYKNVAYEIFDEWEHEEFFDFKFGVGFHCYVSSDISVNIGIDFTNMGNDNYEYKWKNTICQPHLSLAYNF